MPATILISDTGAIERIRTLALVGQTASGKTSLAEALLHRAGCPARRARRCRGPPSDERPRVGPRIAR